MGLTIHYKLKTSFTLPADIRTLLESMRQVALDLPFKEVSESVEFEGEDANFDSAPREDPYRWFKIQAGRYVDDPHVQGRSHKLSPRHIIGFSTWPGEGCEEANFGFCRYPAYFTPQESRRRLATNLGGWSWRSFCKTQYASDPRAGGVQNFLRCHLLVVKMLDFAKKTGLIEVEVHDESDYWENRDLKKLAEIVGEWNECIAAMAGMIKDAAQSVGLVGESAIEGFQNFEHLEFKGLERLRELRSRKS